MLLFKMFSKGYYLFLFLVLVSVALDGETGKIQYLTEHREMTTVIIQHSPLLGDTYPEITTNTNLQKLQMVR